MRPGQDAGAAEAGPAVCEGVCIGGSRRDLRQCGAVNARKPRPVRDGAFVWLRGQDLNL